MATDVQSAPPNRRGKQLLTLIPEQERSIDYRFEFVIVGECARTFVENLVNSEMAEAFRPTAKGIAKEDSEQENQENALDEAAKSQLVLFCPIGDANAALARIRFSCIEEFSISLPLSHDTLSAQNQALVFLYFPNLIVGDRNPKSKPLVDEFKSDFLSRWAELNYHPAKCRPYTIILALEAESDEATLETLATSKKVHFESNPDGAEDVLVDVMRGICDRLVLRQCRTVSANSQTAESIPEGVAVTTPKAASTCCALL